MFQEENPIITYRKQTYQLNEVFNLDWFKSIKKNSIKLQKDLYLYHPTTPKGFLVAEALTLQSQGEGEEFHRFKTGIQEIYILHDKKQYIGFLIWSIQKESIVKGPILRAIYIKKEYRCKGYMKACVQYWINEIVRANTKYFQIEVPNYKTSFLLGYIMSRHKNRDIRAETAPFCV